MELKPVAPAAKGPASRFVGDVYSTAIAGREEPSPLIAAVVRFVPGARTHWHSHALGQTLYVTEGVGLVGTRDGEVVCVRAGDTVYAPPGEEHWHGATAGDVMCHVAMVVRDGDAPDTTWLEAVSDEEFQAANEAVAPSRVDAVR
ncbi:(R)-mandelonitrile lyase [Streptomyces siamensis]|uniref:Cupin domain-containing protein n=1 Tax=Streptomyces siamensis TaxID=1274986 RepID=A0ABP9IZL2_9ACTN